jgi:hypothetical protein
MRSVIISWFFIAFSSCALGQNIQCKIDSLRPNSNFYEFFDPASNKLYSHGWMEQEYPFPVFRKVNVSKSKKQIEIEGITTVAGDASDTADYGLCCFDVLVAQAKSNGILYNVRHFGKSKLKSDSHNVAGRDGFFSLKFKRFPNDVMIIGNAGRVNTGAIAYYVGRLLD